MSKQNETINKKIEITKKNQTETLDLKVEYLH